MKYTTLLGFLGLLNSLLSLAWLVKSMLLERTMLWTLLALLAFSVSITSLSLTLMVMTKIVTP